MRAILFAFLFGAAIAAPADDLALRAPTIACSTVRKAVTAAGVASQATAFCSSYLSIPTITNKVTSTNTATVTATTTATTGTSTVTVQGADVSITTTATTTSTLTVTTFDTISTLAGTVTVSTSTVVLATQTVLGGNCITGAAAKRAAPQPKPKPPVLSSYAPSAPLSSACSCLSIPTPTSTSTLTASATVTTTSTAKVAATITTTAHSTITSSVTVTITALTTSTSTVTTPYYATTTTTSTQTSLGATVTSANFKIQGHAPGNPYDGNYGRVGGILTFRETSSIDSADVFNLASDCAITIVSSIDVPTSVGNIGYENNYYSPHYINFQTRGSQDPTYFGTLACSIDRATMQLNCVVNDNYQVDYMTADDGVWQIYTDTQGNPLLTLEVIPV